MAAPPEPLRRASFSVHLDRDPETVFAFLTDLPNTLRWRSHLDEIRWADDGGIRVGRRIEVVTSFAWWRRIELTCEVTAFEPPSLFAYRIVEGRIRGENQFRCEPEGDGCRFTMDGGDAEDSLAFRLFGPLIERAYGRTTRRELDRLKAIIEGEPEPEPEPEPEGDGAASRP